MKKNAVSSLLTALFLLGGGFVTAQTLVFEWVKSLNGSSPGAPLNAVVTDLDTDPAGNTYLCGEFRNTLDLGNGMILTGNGDDAVFFLAKYSAAGQPQWAKKIMQLAPSAGPAFNYSAKISLDNAGNVHWCGNYRASSLDFGSGTTITRSCNNDCQEGFLARVGPDGALAFVKAIRAAVGQEFSISGVAAAPGGEHAVTGTYTGAELWLQGGANIGGLASEGYFLAYYNANGGAEWIAFQNPDGGQPRARSIAMSPNGTGIVVSGTYDTPAVNFGNGAFTESDAPVRQFFVWYNTLGQPTGVGTLDTDEDLGILDLKVDAQQRVWSACDFRGNLRWNGATLATVENGNMAIVNMRPEQANLAAPIEFSGNSYPVTSLALRADGQWYAGGYFSNSVNVPGAGVLNSAGCADLLLLGGASQTINWARKVGGGGCEYLANEYYGALMDADDAGHIYLAGSFVNNGVFDSHNLSGNGLWVGKLGDGMVNTGEKAASELSISPNPAQDAVSVTIPAPGRVRVFAASGQLMQDTYADQTTFLVPTAHWPAGLYYLEFKDTNGQFSTRKWAIVR
jgi:hypothetical protein